jgi:hypothetical protein
VTGAVVVNLPNTQVASPTPPGGPADVDVLLWMLAALAELEPWTPGRDAAIPLGLAVGRARIKPADSVIAGTVSLALVEGDDDEPTRWWPFPIARILGAWNSAYAPLAPEILTRSPQPATACGHATSVPCTETTPEGTPR